MRKQLLFKTLSCVLFISCFAVKVSYCQQSTILINNNPLDFLKPFFIYTIDTKAAATDIFGLKTNMGEIMPIPYFLLPDSVLTTIEKSDEVIVINSNDSINLNDTINIVSNDADSLDNKEANANSIQMPETPAGKDIKTDDGMTTMPATLADKKFDRLINKYAEMISVEPEDVKNYSLYRFINDWYGVRYKWGGTDNSGIDCSAFSQKLYGKIYSTNIERTARQQHRSSEKIKDYGEANEGDLVFFRIHHIRITHVGVYLANGYFVHASRSHGVVISSLDDKYWRSRYAGCGKIAKQERSATESDFVQ